MKTLKELLQQSKQKTYMLEQAFAEGTWVENDKGEIGKIHRRGVNYVIAITEDNKMFRAWVKDIKETVLDKKEKISNQDKVKFFINKNKRYKLKNDAT
jgi:Ser-tRNA(Ala) deacylase AlaX